MFKLVTETPDLWKDITGLSLMMVEEMIINVTPDGLQIKALTFDNASMFDFFWEKDKFKEYECDEEQKIAFRLDEVNKILSRIKGGELTVELVDNGNMKISSNLKSYIIRLVSTDMIKFPPSPKIEYPVDVEMDYDIFKEKIQDVTILGGSFVVEAVKGQLKFKGNGDSSKGETIYNDDSINTDERIDGEFQPSYIDNALKAIKTKKVLLGLENKKPMRLRFIYPGFDNFNFYLAPVMERN